MIFNNKNLINRGDFLIYVNLINEIVKSKMSLETIANELSINVEKLNSKLMGTVDFNLREINMLLKIFPNHSFEYLLKRF